MEVILGIVIVFVVLFLVALWEAVGEAILYVLVFVLAIPVGVLAFAVSLIKTGESEGRIGGGILIGIVIVWWLVNLSTLREL